MLASGLVTGLVRRSLRPGRVAAVVTLAAAAGAGAVAGWRFPDVGLVPGWMYGIPVLVCALVAGVVAAVLIGGRRRPARPRGGC